MQSEVMGKTLAMFMVIAMIATGIAMLPTGAIAAESYTITGKVLNNIGDAPLEGVTVIIDIECCSFAVWVHDTYFYHCFLLCYRFGLNII